MIHLFSEELVQSAVAGGRVLEFFVLNDICNFKRLNS